MHRKQLTCINELWAIPRLSKNQKKSIHSIQMNLVNYLQFLEPVQEHVTRVYSTASEIITVLLVLWCLNFIAGMIQRTYATGNAFGRFYRNYLHKSFKGIFLKLNSIGKNKHVNENDTNTHSPQTRQAA